MTHPWYHGGGGSEEEIVAMLNSHYDGIIDIVDYWAVGDSREISLSTDETIELVVIGMNHDSKADESGNVAITVQTKNCLNTAQKMYNKYSGYDLSLWANSIVRTFCNGSFKTSLPTWLQELIKPTTKLTNRYGIGNTGCYYRAQATTTDDVFLLSEFEAFGNRTLTYSAGSNDYANYGDLGSDGTQYEYMKTQANRVKSGGSSTWWLRTGYTQNNGVSSFITVNSGGSATSDGSETANLSNSSLGVSPAFCL